MPQEFWILECYSCRTFQVHQKKKSLKWECKMCGEKQSIKKIFFEGSARDCRTNVQKLNLSRGRCSKAINDDLLKNQKESMLFGDISSTRYFNTDEDYGITSQQNCSHELSHLSLSKWNKFIEPETDEENDQKDNAVLVGDTDLNQNDKGSRFCQLIQENPTKTTMGESSLVNESKRKYPSSFDTDFRCTFTKRSKQESLITSTVDNYQKKEKTNGKNFNKSFEVESCKLTSCSVKEPRTYSRWNKFCEDRN